MDQHPDPEGMLLLICAANRQKPRGRFYDRRALEKVLGSKKRVAEFLSPRSAGRLPDVAQLEDGTFYLVGWDEWQEGDWTVGERQRRIRERRAESRHSPLHGNDDNVTEPLQKRDRTPVAIKPIASQTGLGQEDIQSDPSDWFSAETSTGVNFSERRSLIQPPPPVPPTGRPDCPSCGQWESVRSDKDKPKSFFCGTKLGGCGHNWTLTPPPAKDRDYLAELRASGVVFGQGVPRGE